MYERICEGVSMITAASRGASTELSVKFKDLIPCILRALQSPLAAPGLAKLYLELRNCAFTKTEVDVVLADLIAHTTLRLQKPKCSLNPAWEEEQLG